MAHEEHAAYLVLNPRNAYGFIANVANAKLVVGIDTNQAESLANAKKFANEVAELAATVERLMESRQVAVSPGKLAPDGQ